MAVALTPGGTGDQGDFALDACPADSLRNRFSCAGVVST